MYGMASGCFRCGASEGIFDAVGRGGVVKVCEACSIKENIPILKKQIKFDFNQPERISGVYERLSRLAGLNARDHKAKFSTERIRKEEHLKQQNTSLKEIIDRNYQKNLPKNPIPRDDLVSNFHWIIMRARRMKKLTQEQLATAIGETETAIKMAEQGIISADNNLLIDRLERFLGIRVKKRDFEFEKPKELDLSKASSKELTIADLKEMKALNESVAIKQELEDENLLNEEFKRKLEEVMRKE